MGRIDYEVSREYVSEHQYHEIMHRGLPRFGDLLLTTEAPLGNVALVDREDVALAQRVIRFRINDQYFLPKFAMYSVMAGYFQHQLQCRATGSTAEGIKASKLPQLRMLAPPVKEQYQIVSWIHDKTAEMEAGIRNVTREIDLVREYCTRLIADVVTGKVDVRDLAARLPETEETDSPENVLLEDEAAVVEGPELAKESAGADD